MSNTIIDWWNSPVEIEKLLLFCLIFFLVWHLYIKKILKKQPVTSFWYQLYKAGFCAALGILFFVSIMLSLVIASVQGIMIYGTELLLPLAIFWGIVGPILYSIIKAVLK